MSWELSAIKALQALASPLLDAFFTAVGELGGDVLWLAAVFILLALRRRREGLSLAFLLLAGFYISYALKYAVGRPRPPVELQRGEGPRTDPSMPSTHATEAAANLGFLASLARRKWAYVACASLAVLTGLSRVYFGLHWPTDVLAGLALGLLLLSSYVILLEHLWPRLRALWSRKQVLLPLALATGLLTAFFTPRSWGRPPSYIGGLVAGVLSGSVLSRGGRARDHRDPSNLVRASISCSVGLAGLAATYLLLSGIAQFTGAALTGLWASWIGPELLWAHAGGQRRSVGFHGLLMPRGLGGSTPSPHIIPPKRGPRPFYPLPQRPENRRSVRATWTMPFRKSSSLMFSSGAWTLEP
ncbi:hypothetical protein DRO32_02300 [Candidatus Bathyarchaeota archaeon]|nr:MAG: hypothetical protein DRO32_02300 [Candidatus Bathyarchaeota archaeon]